VTNDPKLHTVIVEDLRHVTEEWSGQIEDHGRRREATALRRLLVEQDLGRAWRNTGFSAEPTIVATSLPSLAAGVDEGRVWFASSGGGDSHGVIVQQSF
jgi:hypothetical protein